jgi:rhodanese-related sulfurtransferase
VTADALHTELAAKDFLLINVHTPHTEDIPGTDAALAYTDVDAIVAFVGKDLAKKVVVYCAGTSMSKPVGTELAARGYTDVRYLLGGYMGWKSAGYPLTP